jgi:hypothetical protein
MANTAETANGGMKGMGQGDRRSIHRREGYHTPVGEWYDEGGHQQT